MNSETNDQFMRFLSDTNFLTLCPELYQDSSRVYSEEEKQYYFDLRKNAFISIDDFVNSFFRLYKNFKGDYDNLEKLNLRKHECLAKCTNPRRNEQEILIWLDDDDNYLPTSASQKSPSKVNIVLMKKIGDDGSIKFNAFLDDPKESKLIKNHSDKLDISDDVIREYFELCNKHKQFIDIYSFISSKFGVVSKISLSCLIFQIIGDPFGGIKKFQFKISMDYSLRDCYVRAMYLFNDSPELLIKKDDKNWFKDEDVTVAYMSDRVSSESDLKSIAQSSVNKIYIKKDFYKHQEKEQQKLLFLYV